MTLWPRSLAVRLALASIAAVAAVVALHRAVEARERAAATRASPRWTPLPSPLPALGFRLEPTEGQVLLASRLEAIAPDVAPVLQVLADGSLAVRRPPRLATAPGRTAGAPVAIVVPRAALSEWSPAARVALAELLATLVEVRPFPAARLQVVDVPFGANELPTLLAWLP